MARAASRRSATRRTAPRLTPAQRDRAVEQMLRILFEFMFALGATAKDIRSVFDTALRRAAKQPYRMSEAREFEILRVLASGTDILDPSAQNIQLVS